MDISSFEDLLRTWGYLLLFLYSLGGGYVGIVAAGILSAVGIMDIFLSVITSSAANFIGSSALSFLVRLQKTQFTKYLKKHSRKLALSFIWLKKYGIALIFFNKYIYGVKTFVPIAIGISKYSLKKFMIYNVFSSALWGILVGGISFYSAEFVKEIFAKLANLPSYTMPLFLVLLGLFFVASLKIYSKKKEKGNK
ncbi:MAG: DedA family protein [Helicobacter sp.]|nr:DedA family protein [Helicobacter sp.]